MARVTVTVNGYAYDLTCDDGEEGHVRALARSVDERIAGLVAAIGQAGESRLLLLASLLITHELLEARKSASPSSAARSIDEDRIVLDELATLINRMEAIAARLEEA